MDRVKYIPMTKRMGIALALVISAMLIATAVGMLGLHALGASDQIVTFGFIVPLLVGCPAVSLVVMHYGESSSRR